MISDGVRTIAAGAFYSMVLKEDGSIWATGSNKDGQFGDGSTSSSINFTKISPFGNGVWQDHAQINLFYRRTIAYG